MCRHDNGIAERRVVRADRIDRTVKKECLECGHTFGYEWPDNPAPCTPQELLAYQAGAAVLEPSRWGVVRYRLHRSARRPRPLLVELPPAECPEGHPLGPDTLMVRRRNPTHSTCNYTCRTCHDTDPFTATWQPATAPRSSGRRGQMA